MTIVVILNILFPVQIAEVGVYFNLHIITNKCVHIKGITEAEVWTGFEFLNQFLKIKLVAIYFRCYF